MSMTDGQNLFNIYTQLFMNLVGDQCMHGPCMHVCICLKTNQVSLIYPRKQGIALLEWLLHNIIKVFLSQSLLFTLSQS